jgi:hypothetical protein
MMPPFEIVKKNNGRYGGPASSRSIASSITFSEIDATDFSLDLDPFLEASISQLNDSQAVMPQRRQSVLTSTAEQQQDRLFRTNQQEHQPADSRPGMPQRRQSKAIMTSIITEETLRSSVDSSPSLPTRQQSVASVVSQREEFGIAPRTNHPSMLSSSPSSTSTSAEPLPEYLQPAFAADIEAKLQELASQAETFRGLVDVRDRKYHMKTYPNCFIGSEAVDALLEAGLAESRAQAVELGRQFQKYLGLFHHVLNVHVFKDKYLFYKFATDNSHPSNRRSSSSSIVQERNSALLQIGQSRPSSQKNDGPWYSLQERETIVDEDINEDDPMMLDNTA